ncbi:hypothetical protein Tco_0522396 [Tanacetum coccineum]
MINQCLTGKTSGHDRPRYPVLQMLWGIITITNVDYAELMWEEFIQAIQTFLTDKANLGSPTKKGRKYNPHVIPYSSPFHLTEEDLRLGNLKFVSKGKVDEVFGMPIPNELISNNIKNAPYYNAYLEMVAKHDQKIAAEKEGKKKLATVKQLKPKLAKEISSKPVAATKPKVTKEKPSKPSYVKHPKRGKVQKLHKGKPSLQLIDEDEPTQPEPEPEHQGEGEEYDVECAIQMSLESFQAQSQAHVGDAKTGADTDKTNSGEKTAEINKGQAGSDPGKTPESRPPPDDDKIDEDQDGPDPGVSRVALAGPNPEPTHEEFMANMYPDVHEILKFPADEHDSHGFVCGYWYGFCDSLWLADSVFGKIGETRDVIGFLKTLTRFSSCYVLLQQILGMSVNGKTLVFRDCLLSLINNFYIYILMLLRGLLILLAPWMILHTSGPEFVQLATRIWVSITFPSTVYMFKAATTVLLVSNSLVTDHVSLNVMRGRSIKICDRKSIDGSLVNTARIAQFVPFDGLIDSQHVILEEPLSSSGALSFMKNLDDAYTIVDQFINNKSTEDEPCKLNMESEVVSMVTVLIHQASSSVPPLSIPIIDLSPPKLVSSTTQAQVFTATPVITTTTLPPPPQQQSTTESELAAQAVHMALQALLRDCFRELPEADMKEILHQRMFETGTYKSLPEHVALYEALKASMEWVNKDEFLAERINPPPPLPHSDLSKKKRHDFGASGPHSEQPVENVPMTDTANISNSKDTNSAHLLKIKQRPEIVEALLQ